LTGCGVKYSREEMIKTLKERLPEKDKEFIVSKKNHKIKCENGEGYYPYDVYYKDNPDLVFQLAQYTDGGEPFTTYIVDTYAYTYGVYYYNNFCKNNKTDLKVMEWNSKEFIKGLDGECYPVNGFTLYYCIKNRSDFENAINEMKKFDAFLSEQDHKIYYDYLLIDKSGKLSKLEGIVRVGYNINRHDQSSYDEAMSNYVSDLATYRIKEMYDFSTEELIHYLNMDDDNKRITIQTVDGRKKTYEDMPEGRTVGINDWITFGSLYEILKRNGFNVTGDSEAFSVKGLDGSKYEFSYEFYDNDNERKNYGYYYLKDNNKVFTYKPYIDGKELDDISDITIPPKISPKPTPHLVLPEISPTNSVGYPASTTINPTNSVDTSLDDESKKFLEQSRELSESMAKSLPTYQANSPN
jgi:hypothetical protein